MAVSRREQLLAQLRNNLAIATKAAGFEVGSAKSQAEVKSSGAQPSSTYNSSGVHEKGLSSQNAPTSFATVSSSQSVAAGSSTASTDLWSNRALSTASTTSSGSSALFSQTRPMPVGSSTNEDLMAKVLKTIPGIEGGMIAELLKQRERAKEANAALSATQARLNVHSASKPMVAENVDNNINMDQSASTAVNEIYAEKAPLRILSAGERAQLISAMEEMHGSISALQDALASLSDMKMSMLERPESSHRDALIQENVRMQDDLNKQLWSVNHAATEIAKKLADDATTVSCGFASAGADSLQQRQSEGRMNEHSSSSLVTGPDTSPGTLENISRNQPRRALPTLKIISEGASEAPATTSCVAPNNRPQTQSPTPEDFPVFRRRSASPRKDRERSGSRGRDSGRRGTRRFSTSRSPSGDRIRQRRRSRSRSNQRHRDSRRRSGSRGRDRSDRRYSRTGRRSSSRDSLKDRSKRRRSTSRDLSGSRTSRKTLSISSKADGSQKKAVYIDITSDTPHERDIDEIKRKELNRKGSASEVKKVASKNPQELAVEMAMNAYMKAEEFCDGGSQWCKSCECVLTDIVSLCRHLHSDAHQRKLNPDFDKSRPAVSQQVSINSNVAPARGYEFLMPMSAFFCSVCCEFVKNESEAEQHIKGTAHNSKFKEFLKTNPGYEPDYLMGKMAAILQSSVAENGNSDVSKTPATSSARDKFQLKITGSLKSKRKVLPGIDALGSDSDTDDETSSLDGATQKTTPTDATTPIVVRKFGVKRTPEGNPGQKTEKSSALLNNSVNLKPSTLGWQLAAVMAQRKNSASTGVSTSGGSTSSNTEPKTVGGETFSLDMFDVSTSQQNTKPPPSAVKTTLVKMSDFVAVDEC